MPESTNKKKSRHRQIREYVNYVKSASCCTICGEGRSACLDFHHKDPLEKCFGVSDFKGRGISSVKAEIKKCIVICANCHRILHAEEEAERIVKLKAGEIFSLFEWKNKTTGGYNADTFI